MSSVTVATVTKMLETLPDPLQERVAEHLREYIQDVRDEGRWDELFRGSQNGLAAAARKAREQIAQGLAKPSVAGSPPSLGPVEWGRPT